MAAHWIADRQTGPSLLAHGSEEQKRRFLPAIARGECFFAIGMSEPDSGSDLASVRSRAAGTVADIAHQLHGAVGVTFEHDLRQTTLRLWSWREEYGNEATWADELGTLAVATSDGAWPLIAGV